MIVRRLGVRFFTADEQIEHEDVKRILINANAIERTFVWPLISGPTGVSQRLRELIANGQPSCNFITADGFSSKGRAK